MHLVGCEGCVQGSLLVGLGFFFNLEWSAQCGRGRKVTFTKMRYWSLFML